MIVGQKVVCVDDKFPLEINELYTALPKAGVTYVIRQVSIGVNWSAEPGEVCLLLIGLHNPRSSVSPFPERGFNSERFRPLEEVQAEAKQTLPELVNL
jgi:hypothetical protein